MHLGYLNVFIIPYVDVLSIERSQEILCYPNVISVSSNIIDILLIVRKDIGRTKLVSASSINILCYKVCINLITLILSHNLCSCNK